MFWSMRGGSDSGARRRVVRWWRGAVAVAAFVGLPTSVAGQLGCPAPATLEGGAVGSDVRASASARAGRAAEPDHLMGVVRYLSHDALEGRLAGSAMERCAGEYIAQRMRDIGLDPGIDGGFFQEVELASVVNPHAPAGTGRNVMGVLRGRAPVTDGYVIVGAHYDHLGRGEFGSMAGDDVAAIHNGADDNASGVAAMLEAARLLASGPELGVPVVFVAFTGEESGLLGSAGYVRGSPYPIDAARAMINLDMVGRLESDPLIVSGTGTAEQWPELVARRTAEAGIEVAMEPEGYGPSDHTSFYTADVPVLHLFTNVHGDYHRPSDDWPAIDSVGLDRIARLVATLTRDVADRPAPLTLVRGAGAPPSEGGGYDAYLGSIPDFAPVDFGVRLSGVSADSPAERAGLEAGDVLIGFGGEEIADLYALTDALRAHEPGETVEVVVRRDGDEKRFRVRLGSRGER